MVSLRVLPYIIAFLALPVAVEAHLVGGHGLLSGVTHPFGLDHLLAMVAVGIIATRTRRVWLLPSIFVGAMLVGGLAAIGGLDLPFVEGAIALSVVMLGVAVALARLHTGLAMGVVALSALFHGHAHGTEMPLIASPWLYALGFVAATAVLHAAGVSIAWLAARTTWSSYAVRAGGVAMAIVGVALLGGF